MYIIGIRTDKPEAEIALYEDDNQLVLHTWQAHRQLAETIHSTLNDVLSTHQLQLKDISGIVVWQGPGSFTGLRIGIAVANALAQSLQVPIIGATGERWLEDGVKAILQGENQKIITPEYGAPVHITAPRK